MYVVTVIVLRNILDLAVWILLHDRNLGRWILFWLIGPFTNEGTSNLHICTMYGDQLYLNPLLVQNISTINLNKRRFFAELFPKKITLLTTGGVFRVTVMGIRNELSVSSSNSEEHIQLFTYREENIKKWFCVTILIPIFRNVLLFSLLRNSVTNYQKSVKKRNLFFFLCFYCSLFFSVILTQ